MSDTPIGFPPQRTPQTLRSLLSELRSEADDRRLEATTGRIADPVAALDGRAAEALGLERQIGAIAGFRQSIALAETRAGTSQRVIDGLRESIDDIANQTQLALENRASSGLETASAVAREALESAVAALNTRAGGRSLFAGDAGDSQALAPARQISEEVAQILEAAPDAAAAIADVSAAFNDAGGLFETALYTGGTGEAPAAEVALGERVAHQARADEPPFRDILRAFAMIAAANDPDTVLVSADREEITEAAVLALRNAVDPLNRVASRIGAGEARIETVKTRLVAEESALTANYNAFTGADQLFSASRLAEIEAQLETLFLTTARFTQLSLVNFLR